MTDDPSSPGAYRRRDLPTEAGVVPVIRGLPAPVPAREAEMLAAYRTLTPADQAMICRVVLELAAVLRDAPDGRRPKPGLRIV